MLDVENNRRTRNYSSGEMIRRVMWNIAQPLFRFSPRPCFGWRRFLLRCFGAKIGRSVHVYPSATIYFPWHLEAGDESAIGEHVFIYNLGSVTLGSRVTVSHRAHLCAGTHDHTKPDFPLLRPPIVIGSDAWICADAFVGPGVTVGEGAIVGARAVAMKDVKPRSIVVGNPARESKKRESSQMSERSDARVPLSVLVPVKNEAANLRDCLASVSFAQEIVVVDSGSTDGTQAIAEAAGARVIQFAWNGKLPRKKNWALENVPWQHEWVLIIDADERITPELEREIRQAICRTDVDGFYLNRRFWFLDGWINHCGYFPSWNLRLFRHRLGRYEQIEIGNGIPSGDNEVHEHVLLNGRVEYLPTPMEHYAFPDIATFIEKHDRYSSWEAAAWRKLHSGDEKSLRSTPFGTGLERKRWVKKATIRAPFRPSLRFLYHYVWKQGFRDGYRGWVLCRLLAGYERMIVTKERELKKRTATSPAAL